MLAYISKSDKTLCCGCRACEQACPQACITMTTDSEGFLYPEIKKEFCSNCKICSNVCPIENSSKCFNDSKQEVYAAYHKNKTVNMNSSSGGAFTAIVDTFCDDDYVVFGATYNNDFTVIHSFAQSRDKVQQFRKSKYVQSDLRDSYSKAKEFLEQGKKVLFSGTSCQIAGLKTFLNKNYPSLFTVDIICHGVPSPAIFKKYLYEMKQKYKSDISSIDFRDKLTGKWGDLHIIIKFKNGQEYLRRHSVDPYYIIFLNDLAQRPVCDACPFTSTRRVSDITIADFWGIENYNKSIPRDDGVSLVISNTPQGITIFNNAKNFMNVTKECFEHAIPGNIRLTKAASPNPRKPLFFRDIDELSTEKLAKKYCVKKNFIIHYVTSRLCNKTKQILKIVLGRV